MQGTASEVLSMRCAVAILPDLLVEVAAARLDVQVARSETAALTRSETAALTRSVEPLAVVVADDKSKARDEQSLRGGTRIDAVSASAFALGVRAGQTIATARGKAKNLAVRVVSRRACTAVLARLCESLLTFGPCTSMRDDDLAAPRVFVDVSGCGHLHVREGEVERDGERRLAEAIVAHVHAQGHRCRVAIADSPTIAAMIATSGRGAVQIIDDGASREAITGLPVGALSLDEATLAWLESLGLRTLGDVQKMPRSALAMRLGDRAAEVMSLIDGDDRTPLDRYEVEAVPEERFDHDDLPIDAGGFGEGLVGNEALLFVVKGLCDRLAARLSGRGLGACHLDLVLSLDRAKITGDSDVVLAMPLATPLTSADDLFAVLRTKLESFTVTAPARTVTLRAPKLAPRGATPRDLFIAEARAERALPRLLAELQTDLGTDRVGVLQVVDRWRAEERSRLVPHAQTTTRARPKPQHALPDAPIGPVIVESFEPLRLLHEPLDLPNLQPIQVLGRLNAIEWWRDQSPPRCDYAQAWVPSLSTTAWVEIDRTTGAMRVRGWLE